MIRLTKERSNEIYELRLAQMTYVDIGKKFGISTARARQIFLSEVANRGSKKSIKETKEEYQIYATLKNIQIITCQLYLILEPSLTDI